MADRRPASPVRPLTPPVENPGLRLGRAALAVAVLLTTAGSPPPSDSGRPGGQAGIPLPEGRWSATFEYEGGSVADGNVSGFRYDGLADFEYSAGAFTGTWSADLTHTNQITRESCSLTTRTAGVMEGTVEGGGSSLILKDTSFSGTLTTSGSPGCDPTLGLERRVPVTTAGGIQVPREVRLVVVSCEVALGYLGGRSGPPSLSGRDLANLRAFQRDVFEPAGIDMWGEDRFEAVLEASLRPSADSAALLGFIDAVNAGFSGLLGRIAESTGPLDGRLLDEMDGLLAQAETLVDLMLRLSGCALADRGTHLSVLADSVARLIQYALENPGRFSAGDLYRLILAGVRAGVLESHSVYVYGTERLAPHLRSEVERRAESGLDCADLLLLLASAEALGGSAKVDAAVAATCGG